MIRIRYCTNCKAYTLGETCKKCSGKTIINAPVKYTKDETIAKYRREIKRKSLDSISKV